MRIKFSLLQKVLLALAAALVLTTTVSSFIFVQRFEQSQLQEMESKAKAIAQLAHNVRMLAGEAVMKQAIKFDALAEEALKELKGMPLGTPEYFTRLRTTRFYNMAIPVVWSFKAAREGAEEAGFTFKPTRSNPRNPIYAPESKAEKELLAIVESGKAEEAKIIDPGKNVLRYMRAVHLTDVCLTCHGRPDNDPLRPGTGKGPLGFPKNGKSLGDLHGAFQVIMDLKPMQARITATRNLVAGTSLGILLIALAIIGYALHRGVIKPVKLIAGEMNAGANEAGKAALSVSETAEGLNNQVNQQTNALSNVSSAMEEIAQTAEGTSQNAAEADKNMQEVGRLIEIGNSKIAEAVQITERLRESSGKMSGIAETIEKIAGKIGMLALNANIEASRAGEHGKGFAVIADEVGKLAEKSEAAAKETKTLLEAAIHQVGEVQSTIEESANSLSEIATAGGNTSGLISSIANAIVEQSKAVTDISRSLSDLSAIVGDTTQATATVATAATELSGQADSLGRIADDLEGLISGGPSTPSSTGRHNK